jgi:2-oxo-4-hydroxy-4-carboxy-5-ureidoimidazoline decarboxylase
MTASWAQELETLPLAEAQARLLRVCGSSRWAREVAQSAPFAGESELLAAAARAFDMLEPDDWLDAFSAHARIAAPDLPEAADRAEQSGLTGATETELAELRAGCAAYEARFGHVFLIRARGRCAADILAVLRDRLQRSPRQELAAAAAEEREIAAQRLQRTVPA